VSFAVASGPALVLCCRSILLAVETVWSVKACRFAARLAGAAGSRPAKGRPGRPDQVRRQCTRSMRTSGESLQQVRCTAGDNAGLRAGLARAAQSPRAGEVPAAGDRAALEASRPPLRVRPACSLGIDAALADWPHGSPVLHAGGTVGHGVCTLSRRGKYEPGFPHCPWVGRARKCHKPQGLRPDGRRGG
jgi:hypothetical protein